MAQLKYWDGSSWVDAVVGAQGIQGPIGIQGNIGPQGIQGTQGTQGLFGPQGIQGVNATFTTINAQSTNYTLALTDQEKLITISNSSSTYLSIPTDADVAFPTGTVVHVAGVGLGGCTIQATTPATTGIQSTGGITAKPYLRTRYSSADCVKVGANLWLVVGDIL